MIKALKISLLVGLMGSSTIPTELHAHCTDSNLNEYRTAYTFETNNLIIAPVTSVEEYQKLIEISQDDKLSYIYKDLSKEYGFPVYGEGWKDNLAKIFANDKFCAKTTLPILFVARKKTDGQLIGFYAYLPRKYEHFENTQLEQRSLLAKEARSGGLGTEFRKAMISYFKQNVLNHEFEMLSESKVNIQFSKDVIKALTSGVAANNFASLISNIRACLPISNVDQDISFMLPVEKPITPEELREGYCNKVIVHDDVFAPNLTSQELNPLVCGEGRPESIKLDSKLPATSPHNIAFSINKVIEEVANQANNCP